MIHAWKGYSTCMCYKQGRCISPGYARVNLDGDARACPVYPLPQTGDAGLRASHHLRDEIRDGTE